MGRVTSTDAVAHIHAELAELRRRRIIALAIYLLLYGVLVAALLYLPHPHGPVRTASWALTLGALFLSSVAATSAAVGVPLWSERTLRAIGVTTGAGLALGLALGVDWNAGMSFGAKCFAFGTLISGLAMILLGIVSGRMWRRFPDPGWLLAIAVAGVGVTTLHFSCDVSDALHIYAFHLGPILLAYALARAAVRTRETLLRDENL